MVLNTVRLFTCICFQTYMNQLICQLNNRNYIEKIYLLITLNMNFKPNSSRPKNSKPKSSAREDIHSKPIPSTVSTVISKISKSIQLTVPIKSNIMLSSQTNHRGSRPKVDSLRLYHPETAHNTVHHSRKMSITSARQQPSTNRTPKPPTIELQTNNKKKKTSKQHLRSNSTISKKSSSGNNQLMNQQAKKCFKLDLTKLIEKNQQQTNKIIIQPKQINRGHFNYEYVIGKGGFGKVWCVQYKKSHKLYAMKQMLKTKIIGKKSIHSVMNQRQLLSKLKHPFIVNMSYAFQDRQTLYLVMDLLTGGDLRYHMGCRRRWSQKQGRFFIASILCGLEFLHLNNIIHRDIKPENLVFDEKGYLRLTDLGIARSVKPNNNADTSGTPGYMAPQVMCRQDHSFAVDYYAVGIIAYELMLGRRPYNGRNRKQIRDQILSKQVQIRAQEVPPGWSLQAADFINRMIQRKPLNRLGTEAGIVQIKQHPWLRNFPWVQLLKRQIQSPFIPQSILNNNDYRDQISSSSEDENEAQNQLLLRRKSIEDLFEGYSYENQLLNNSNKNNQKQKIAATKATTANTHYSYFQEKESTRDNKQVPPKMNNFFNPR